MLSVERQEGHPACKKLEWWGTGMVICLEGDADLHMAKLMLLPLTVSCFSKIQIGFTFLVPAHPGSPGKRADKWVCVYVLLTSCGILWQLFTAGLPTHLAPFFLRLGFVFAPVHDQGLTVAAGIPPTT